MSSFGNAVADGEAPPGAFLASIGTTVMDAGGLSRVFRLLDSVLEFDGMSKSELRDAMTEHVVPIRGGVDQTLDDLRKLQQDVPQYLEDTLQSLASNHSRLSGAALEFIPQREPATDCCNSLALYVSHMPAASSEAAIVCAEPHRSGVPGCP